MRDMRPDSIEPKGIRLSVILSSMLHGYAEVSMMRNIFLARITTLTQRKMELSLRTYDELPGGCLV